MRRAFTLIELLVVVAILATLVALLLPSLAGARAASRNSACLSNLRQLATGHLAYRADHKGAWPTDWECLGVESMPCPADRDRAPFGYLLTDDGLNGTVVWSQTTDLIPWSKTAVAQDSGPFHGWINAGYLDGHAARSR